VILVRHAPVVPEPGTAGGPGAAASGAGAGGWPGAEGAGGPAAPQAGEARAPTGGAAWPRPEGGAAEESRAGGAGAAGGTPGLGADASGAGEGLAPPSGRDELDDELGQAFDKVMGGPEAAPSGLSAGATAAAAGLDAPQESHVGPGATETAAPSSLAAEWYVAIDEQQVGPMPPEELKARWEAGVVGPDSLVWCAGMADWGPLSSVPGLASFLAPFPRAERGSRTAARVEAPRGAAQPAAAAAAREAQPAPAAGAAAGEAGAEWRPGAASALAALASEELSSMRAPAPEPGDGGARGRLLESMNLPDTGGVDPTGAIPLPIKGLDATGERKVSSVARTTQEVRLKRSANRTILVAAAVLLVVFAAGAGALYWYFDSRLEAHGLAVKPGPLPAAARVQATPSEAPAATPFGTQAAPAGAAAGAVAPGGAAPGAVGAPPATAGAPAAAPSAAGATPAVAGAPAAGAAAAPAAEPAAAAQGTPGAPAAPGAPAQASPAAQAAAPSPSAAPPAAVSAAPQKGTPRKKGGKAEPRPQPPGKASQARALASASPTPAGKKTGDPLLDATDVDAAFERELQAGAPPKRSVYVPPATGSDLPDRLTESQIQEGVASRIDALKQCVSEQQAKSPDVHGTLKMQWTIQGDGSVTGVRMQSPELAGQPISSCIANVVKGIRFPRSRTTGQAVSFPFGF
jgi:hypothetical protein